ncbi:MAG TPA: hypothetical protein PKA41_12580 [Verrucomicrobiota bacterium]|nr:hypothetical protein [Verrucomicrobiota bacterium]
MRTPITPSRRGTSGGYALLIVLAIGAVSAVILAASLTHTINTATLNERNNQSVANLNAAEAAVEKVVARMLADFRSGGEDAVQNNLESYREMVPTGDEDPHWDQFEFSDGEGNAGRTHVTVISNRSYVSLESQYMGLGGWVTTYRVLSNARPVTGRFTTHTNAAQQEIQVASIPLFQFAYFYNGLMEFTTARNMTVNGRVHANGDIFFSGSGPNTFNAPVTATGTIQKRESWGTTLGSGTGPTTFNGVPDFRTNVAHLPLLRGVANTSSNLHKIIELPPTGEDVNAWPGRDRFYNKAGMTILVDEPSPGLNRVRLAIKNHAADPNPVPFEWTTNDLPDFVVTTNVFRDRREGKWMKTTQIDVAKLGQFAKSNPDIIMKLALGNPISVVHITDNRPVSNGTSTAVRLVNGGQLSPSWPDGLTVATPNPLYVKGDYNSTSSIPAALVSDALTVLSSRWDDSKTNWLEDARDTTITAAIITGSVPSQGGTGNSPFSGGVQNLVRLLEDWNDERLTLNSSFVNLFDSTRAIGPFVSWGIVYRPPRFRIFDHDPSLADPEKMPPATPVISVVLRARWTSPAPNSLLLDPDAE